MIVGGDVLGAPFVWDYSGRPGGRPLRCGGWSPIFPSQNEKSTVFCGASFCIKATKKIFLSFLNKVSNSHGYFSFTVKFPLRYSIKKDLPPTRTPSSVKYSQSFGIQGLTVIPPSAATDTPTSPEITRSQKVEWL